MKSLIAIVLITSLPIFLSAKDKDGSEWRIDPASKVGKITKTSSEAELVKVYGKENVKKHQIPVGEGTFVAGAILFPGSKNELLIEWKDGRKNPVRITIKTSQGSWWFSNGLKVGNSLDKVEKYNSTAFKLTGFEWDYPGRTTSWEKGKLSKSLQLDFWTDKKIADSDARKVAGDSEFMSSNRVIQKMELKVKTIFIRWD